MARIPNLPDGWTQRSGATYAKVPLSFSETLFVFAEPGVDDVPIEFAGEGFTVAEAEELVQRLTEAIAICKAPSPATAAAAHVLDDARAYGRLTGP